ncbi:hypothetical protein EDB80DRAFT_716554 [Ilyonectria destructans]|nr:hypothetical protein EDB80DRAFT_716554 [Ilyonectria destructans]
MATLAELPNELVRCIAEFLPKEDLLSLRESSRAMNAMTLDIFQRDYFQTRYVMLEDESIENLIDISEHPILRLAVRKLGLCTQRILKTFSEVACLHDPRIDDPNWEPLPDWFPDESDDDSAWLDEDEVDIDECRVCGSRQLLSEQDAFHYGRDRAGLVQAMRNLPNCKTLSLTDARLPWGAVGLLNEVEFPFEVSTGPDIEDCETDRDFVKHVFDTMLVAAAESKLPIESVDIYMGHMDERRSRDPIAVQLLDPPEGLEFANVTHLRLILSPYLNRKQTPNWEPGFTRFLDMFPQLSHFTLGFDGRSDYDYGLLFPRLSKVLSISHLRVVDLARFETTASELARTLARHQATLEDVTLREIKLRSTNWPVLLGELWNMPEVRRLTMKRCMIGDEFMPGISSMPDVVSIVNEPTFSEAIGWVEEANEEMLSREKLTNSIRQRDRVVISNVFSIV